MYTERTSMRITETGKHEYTNIVYRHGMNQKMSTFVANSYIRFALLLLRI